MDTAKESIRTAIYGSPLFFPLRSAYQTLFDRKRLAVREKMQRFYSQFMFRGDRVFDIGANKGIYSECFSALGARVIAVEPHPGCCKRLALLAKNRPVTVVSGVVDALPGKRMVHVAEYSEQTTVTDNWNEESSRVIWTDHVEVEAFTLDQLAAKYGTPSFVKIDVEGFEKQALSGMSFTPRGFSFEFNRTFPQVALSCLDMPIMDKYEFNLTRGLEMSLASPSWMSASAMKEKMDSLAAPDEFGDVIGRFNPLASTKENS